MNELESSLHLFQPPLYRARNGIWTENYNSAVSASGQNLAIDPISITSILSFGWVAGDNTLVSGISRRPWLSKIAKDGSPILESIPRHDTFWENPSLIANKFISLLCEEALDACKNRDEIYLLLTGGLDSRIIAGILAKLYREGKLASKPIALTWGSTDSRDSVYAKRIANLLNFEWQNIELTPEYVLKNIKVTASELGCMHTPECLHASLWLETLPQNALVLAGSYGDSVGRAEFGGRHLLEISHFKPQNVYGLLQPEIFAYTSEKLLRESAILHSRSPGEPDYVLCEHEMQGFRMRGGLSHAMSLINKYCSVYQMFTSPTVYGYIWSLHPSLRTNRIYAEALENLNPALARIPWARTNKALSGKTLSPERTAGQQYHSYTKWSSEVLYSELSNYIHPEWFEATGLFLPEKINALSTLVKDSQQRVGRLNEVWLWLASFRHFVENIEASGKNISYDIHHKEIVQSEKIQVTKRMKDVIFTIPRKCSPINKLSKIIRENYRAVRRCFLRRQAIREFPPKKQTNQL